MAHVCPWWGGYFIDNRLRHWLHDPERIVAPYVRPGMTVIDIGCGMGFFSIALARMVGPAGQVLAVDLQPQMLRTLERRARRAGVADRIRTRQAESCAPRHRHHRRLRGRLRHGPRGARCAAPARGSPRLPRARRAVSRRRAHRPCSSRRIPAHDRRGAIRRSAAGRASPRSPLSRGGLRRIGLTRPLRRAKDRKRVSHSLLPCAPSARVSLAAARQCIVSQDRFRTRQMRSRIDAYCEV